AAQLPTGGWEYGPGFGANGNSTALVIQALRALGEKLARPDSVWAKEGVSPLISLLVWQGANGAFQADFGSGRFDDFFTTVQAIPAVASRPYPLTSQVEEDFPWLAATILLVAAGALAVWSFRRRL
ncbi:MAG: hypothetical protein AB1791_01620, partial [Chloroflexota bacterium]